MSQVTVRIEWLTEATVASAVELAVRVLRVKPGDREEQFATDITGEHRQMFVAKANGQVVAYGRILELAGSRTCRDSHASAAAAGMSAGQAAGLGPRCHHGRRPAHPGWPAACGQGGHPHRRGRHLSGHRRGRRHHHRALTTSRDVKRHKASSYPARAPGNMDTATVSHDGTHFQRVREAILAPG